MTNSSLAFEEKMSTDTETRPVSRSELLLRYTKQLDERLFGDQRGPAGNVVHETQPTSSYQQSVGGKADAPENLRRFTAALHPVRFEAIERPTFRALQEWEGHVIYVGATTFLARLTDLSVGFHRAEEEVELLISDLSDDDRALLAVGRVFRWAIGYQRSPGGSRKRVSQIAFRRLPQWTRKELDQALKEGAEIIEATKWD